MPKLSPSKKILIAHGVNLDLLGTREPGIYGSTSLATINENIRRSLPEICKNLGIENIIEPVFFQTNDESAYLAKMDDGWWGALLNPGAWTHTSLALADRLKALELKFVEVHLSSIRSREHYRHESYCSQHALGVVQGFGAQSYIFGLHALLSTLTLSPNE